MYRYRKPLVIAWMAFWSAIAVTAVARGHDPVSDNSAALTAVQDQITALESELAALRLQVTDLAQAGVQAKFPRHGLVKLNWLPDPYPVECATTVDVPVACDPAVNSYDADEDPLAWDAGVCLNGTLAIVADVPTYTPPAGFTGTDSCTADVRDDAGYALDVEITVTVTAP